MKVELPKLGSQYSLEMWFWNGLPVDAREFNGFFFSRGLNGEGKAGSDCLGIGGVFDNSVAKGKLIFVAGSLEENMLAGESDVLLRTWNHLVLVRDRRRIAVYLNGKEKPQIEAEAVQSSPSHASEVFIGGSNDRSFNFEGKIAKVAIFDRLLTRREIASHYTAAGQ